MRIEIGKNQGSVVIDDNTGQILSVDVYNVIGNKFDSIGVHSHSRVGDKHYRLKFD